MRTRRIAATVGTILLAAAPALAGRWITPDWPAGKEPQYKAVPLYWFEVRECPVVYRTEVEAPKECDRATVLARTSGYIYVYVDGQLVYGWAPRPKTDKSPEVPADPNRVHEVDFSGLPLWPGRHTLAVSAPAKGVALDGGLYAGAQRVATLATDGKWTAAKFPPTTILEEEPILRRGYQGDAAPVKAGEEWSADEDALARTFAAACLARQPAALENAVWRLELLLRKGLYLFDGQFSGWGGPNRLDRETLDRARGLLAQAETAAKALAPLKAALPATAQELAQRLPAMRRADRDVLELAAQVNQTDSMAIGQDVKKAGALLAKVTALGPQALESVTDYRSREGRAPGVFSSRLNESRYDRLGWINHPGLTDSDISKWGIRINPVTGPTKVAAPQKWLFSTDPRDEGVKELRWSIGYNIETQMATIDGGRGWQADKRFADYKGAAWYRARLHVPGEWAGSEVVLTVPAAGKERLWLNDKEITARGTGDGRRTYRLAPDLVSYGGENFLALRIAAEGPTRGLAGTVEAACPALEGGAGKAAPSVGVLATPLAPCVVLTPLDDTLQIHHAGKARLLVPGSGRPLIEMDAWDGRKGRNPGGNWVLVWLSAASPAAAERPILLVFEKSPAAIACEEGVTRVKLGGAGHRVIAVRPWAKAAPPRTDEMTIASTAHFWSQAALAVPLNYMEVTQVAKPGEPYESTSTDKVPAGPVLAHTIIYDYLETNDEWGTKPVRLAPLPAFCSYAMDMKFRGLALDQKERIETLQDGGLLAPYRAVKDADRVSYSYPVEPYPRFAGFTSWMFSGVDAGVPGNKREMELVAAAGGNSYRPQHNWSDEPPPKYLDPGDGRTRVQITADWCKAAGLNYMNNIDQTLGRKPEEVRADYEKFIPLVYSHYEKIARQLSGRAFWEVAYDLINEPFDHKHEKYNPAMKELTRRVRAIDRRHLLYIEPCEAWGAIQQLALVEPTGDPLTVYSFHDYNFRLFKPTDRWPTLQRDITSIYQMWMPAFKFQIEHGVAMHCGEFGGFAPATNDSLAQTVLMNDFLRIFDQFGMHHHYYSGREIYERLADGSCRPSNVVRAYRAYFQRGDFNALYPKWPGQPSVRAAAP